MCSIPGWGGEILQALKLGRGRGGQIQHYTGGREGQCNCKRGMFLVAQPCPALYNPVDCSPPGSSVHGILQARIPEWVAMPSSRGSTPAQGSIEPRSPPLQVDSLPLEPHGTHIWSEIFPDCPRISVPVPLPDFSSPPQLHKPWHVHTLVLTTCLFFLP